MPNYKAIEQTNELLEALGIMLVAAVKAHNLSDPLVVKIAAALLAVKDLDRHVEYIERMDELAAPSMDDPNQNREVRG